MHFTIAALVEFSTRKGRRRQKKDISSIVWTNQAAGSFKNLVTCHPENIRPDIVLRETANDSVDWRAGILSTVWVVVASQEQLMLTECRIRITSFGAEGYEGVMAASLSPVGFQHRRKTQATAITKGCMTSR